MDKINPLLKIGDHVIARRFAYTHHGLYLGEGMVLEYVLEGGVMQVSLEEFADGRSIYIREHQQAPYQGKEAVNRGMSRLGENHYNLLTCNCEHFVNWCIDGVENSRQVDNFILTIIPFYSIFHKSDFVRGCLKVIFDNPASLDQALERININNPNVQDPLTRAKELSEDVFGSQHEKVIKLTSRLTNASQLSKEFNSWLNYRRHSFNFTKQLHHTLKLPQQALHTAKEFADHFLPGAHHTDKKSHTADQVPVPVQTPVQAATTAPAPQLPHHDAVFSPQALKQSPNQTPHTLPQPHQILVEANFVAPRVRSLDDLRGSIWAGGNMAALTAAAVMAQHSMDGNSELDPELSDSKLKADSHKSEFEGDYSLLLPNVHITLKPAEEATAEELASVVNKEAVQTARDKTTVTTTVSIESACYGSNGGDGLDSIGGSSDTDRASERYTSTGENAVDTETVSMNPTQPHRETRMLNGEEMNEAAAHDECQRMILEYPQPKVEMIVDPTDWHSNFGNQQAVRSTKQCYQSSTMDNAYPDNSPEAQAQAATSPQQQLQQQQQQLQQQAQPTPAYSISDLALDVVDKITQDFQVGARQHKPPKSEASDDQQPA